MAEIEIQREAAAFRASVEARQAEARQIAALQIACGIDLSDALNGDPGRLGGVISKLQRAIERERLRGMRRHWSYDLNRHIALKEVLDRLRAYIGRAGRSAASGKGKDRRPVATSR